MTSNPSPTSNPRYLTTKDSIAGLFALAEERGEITIRLGSQDHCYKVRNQLYKHRAAARKAAKALTGLEASHLDGFGFEYQEEFAYHPSTDGLDTNYHPTGRWLFTITYNLQIEFELLLPPDWEGTIPHLDVAPSDHEDDLPSPDWKEDDELPF